MGPVILALALFASSLWLIGRRRLLAHIERRHGKAAMLAAASRGKKIAQILVVSAINPCPCHIIGLAASDRVGLS
jgi:hypothetical protein